MSVSQCVPVNPGKQSHVYAFISSMHMALFWHGLDAQSSIFVLQLSPVKPVSQKHCCCAVAVLCRHVPCWWCTRFKHLQTSSYSQIYWRKWVWLDPKPTQLMPASTLSWFQTYCVIAVAVNTKLYIYIQVWIGNMVHTKGFVTCTCTSNFNWLYVYIIIWHVCFDLYNVRVRHLRSFHHAV